MNKCEYIEQWDCYLKEPRALIAECEFCLKARVTYVSQWKPFSEDYAKNIGELNTLREKVKSFEAMPK